MLVNCPRCGFQQPQDKYCAQCGVDMENYRAPQPSIAKKIFGNPVLQVGGVLAVAAVVGLSVYQRHRTDLEDRVSYLKNGPQIARSVSSPVGDDAAAEEAPLAETPPADAAFAPTAGTLPSETAVAASTAAATPEGADPAKPIDAKAAADAKTKAATAGKPGETVVRVFFAEVSSPALDQVFEESAATGQYNRMGDFIAGIVPELGKKLSPSNRDIKTLYREQKTIEPGRPLVFFQGVHPGEPDAEVGLSYYIELTETDGNVFRGNVEIIRSWREFAPGPGPATITKKTFPAVFELGRGSGFFMSGLLPRSPIDNNDELLAVAPFSILRSNSFRQNASEAVLFIEFDKN